MSAKTYTMTKQTERELAELRAQRIDELRKALTTLLSQVKFLTSDDYAGTPLDAAEVSARVALKRCAKGAKGEKGKQ